MVGLTNKNMTKLQITAWVIGGIAFIALTLWWSAGHDKAVMEAAERYEACVKVEYNTTPSAWYAEHGEYPEVSGCEILDSMDTKE